MDWFLYDRYLQHERVNEGQSDCRHCYVADTSSLGLLFMNLAQWLELSSFVLQMSMAFDWR